MYIKNDVRRFIVDNFLYGQDDNAMDDDVSFLKTGIIDSTGILELVSFVQETYGIYITDDELLPDNLDSLNKLEAFILNKKASEALDVPDTAGKTLSVN